MVRWASSTQFTGGCCDDCKEMPDSERSVNEKDIELAIEEKNAASSKQGNCSRPDVGDMGQSGKECACCGPAKTSGGKDHTKAISTTNAISLAPDHTNVQVSEEKRSEVIGESGDEKGCCSDCD
ncbi:hypothetical protein AN958_01012 [Leucoagaricus sp. SymC.cos]|nr:hypothetical protein AN958_01012 [Leucoagaricus sp. SymC.cos]